MTTETCRPCAEVEPFAVKPDDDLPLCQGHWNAWMDRYLNFDYTGNEAPPCGAHLIRAAITGECA